MVGDTRVVDFCDDELSKKKTKKNEVMVSWFIHVSAHGTYISTYNGPLLVSTYYSALSTWLSLYLHTFLSFSFNSSV